MKVIVIIPAAGLGTRMAPVTSDVKSKKAPRMPMAVMERSAPGRLLVDFDGLHHAHLFVVHHVAVKHVDAGEVEEAAAEG